MPDPTPPAPGETPPADPPAPTPAPPAPPAPPADPPPPPAGEEHDPVRARALIDKLREKEKDGNKAARERDELKARLDAIDAANLTEAERLQQERDQATAERDALREQRRDDALRLAVHDQRDTLGIASPALAIAALDRSQIEYDEVGRPKNVVELLTALLEREPLLKGKATPPTPIPPTDGGAGNGGSPPELTADELSAAQSTGMSPERYAALKGAMGGQRSISITDATAAVLNQQG